MHTTAGDLELELWATQCPLACRNFLQLCLDDYYTDTIFHRLVPGFIVQGGDPTGTGHGGEAIYPGGLFADEFHSRLKFNRRGLLGMANSGKPDDNGSQFFFTLAETKELNGKNTLFGKVVGETIYNLVKIGERELEEEGSDRMLYPVKITGVEVLVNPFDDVVRRATTTAQKGDVGKLTKAVIGKKKATGKKGKALLSFGGDEDDEEVLPVKKMKFDNRLVSDIPEKQGNNSTPIKPAVKPVLPPAAPRTRHSSPPSLSSSPSPRPAPIANKLTKPVPIRLRPPSPESKPRESFLAKTTAQIEALKASLKRRDSDTVTHAVAPKKRSLLTLQKEMLPSTSIKGRKRKRLGKSKGREVDDDDDAMDALERFRRKLEKATSPPPLPTPPPSEIPTMNMKQASTITANQPDSKGEEEYQLCDLHFIPHCQSCKSWDEAHANDSTVVGSAIGEGDIRPEDFLGHTLRFEKDRLGKDLSWKKEHEYDDGLVLIDPREKTKELAEQRAKEKGGRTAGRYGAGGARGAGSSGSREWDKAKRGDGNRGR